MNMTCLTLACPAMSGAVVRTLEYFAPRLWSAGSGATETKGMLKAWRAPVVSVREAGSPIPIIPGIAKLFLVFLFERIFKQAAISLSFLACNVSHSKQAAIMSSFPLYFSRIFSLPYSVRSESFFISLLYIKPLFPIDQFSIDSFLDWDGCHWDSYSTRSSCHCSQFPL